MFCDVRVRHFGHDRMIMICAQDIECEEGSECTITSERVCELDMCHLEYSGQCTGERCKVT